MRLRSMITLCALAMAAGASAQTEFEQSRGSGWYLGYDPAGNVSFAVTGTIDYEMPVAATGGLKALDDLLVTSAGLQKAEDGTVVFNYLPGDNYKPTDETTFSQTLATVKPKTAYKVDAQIKKVAETPHYISMKATSYTKSLASDGYDIGTVEYVNYNKDTDAVIDYFDVFNASAERRLREMMYPVARKKYPLTIGSSDEMELVENFAITPEGVTFCFPESSIAPASAGCPEISLTWKQLRGGNCLADGIEERIGK